MQHQTATTTPDHASTLPTTDAPAPNTALAGEPEAPHTFPNITAHASTTIEIQPTPNAFADIDRALAHHNATASPEAGCICEFAYELAAVAEPTAFATPTHPVARLHRVAAVGERDAPAHEPGDAPDGWIEWEDASTARVRYEAGVARAVELVHAGDCFQVNLAHALKARTSMTPERVFTRLFTHLRPLFGAFLRDTSHPGARTVISASPELFLEVTPRPGSTTLDGAHVVTRPIKGTRPVGAHHELRTSGKDHAELAMIVDLMRNDLGRVADPGTLHVDESTTIETHHAGAHGGGVAHTAATVSASLRAGVSVGDLLRATLAPGSVTGAPKVRAMQIIDELERAPGFPARGAYCGAIGWIGDDGRIVLSVAIRTLTMTRIDDGCWEIELPVGAGIVADSDPAAEWEETLVKARPLIDAIGGAR